MGILSHFCVELWTSEFARERSCAQLIGMSGDSPGSWAVASSPLLRRVYAGMRIVLSEPYIEVKRLRRVRMGGMILAYGFCGGCHI
jgi:hypothetical protein